MLPSNCPENHQELGIFQTHPLKISSAVFSTVNMAFLNDDPIEVTVGIPVRTNSSPTVNPYPIFVKS